MKIDNVKIRASKALRYMCLFIVLLFASIICIIKSFTFGKETSSLLYAYNISKSSNYQVHLKENEFIQSEYLEMEKNYVTNLVDKILVNYQYIYSSSKIGKTIYTYRVVADVTVNYSKTEEEEKMLYTKQYSLMEPKTFELENNYYKIEQEVEIDFNSINEEVKKFRDEMRMTIESDLKIKLIVDAETEIEGIEGKIVETSDVELKMDLNEQVFNIVKNYEESNPKNITNVEKTEAHTNKILLYFGIIILSVAVIGLLETLRRLVKYSQKSEFAIALNRILKNYGDIVAEIVTPVQLDGMRVIDVKNFDQLLDIEEEIKMPILYYEVVEDEEGEFIIINDNIAYRYIVGRKRR